MDPHSRAPKKNTSHGNEVLPQDTTYLIQRPSYQRGSPCQDPAGNWTTRRSPDDRKETQTAVVRSHFLFIRSGQNHLARHSERGKKTRQTKKEVRHVHTTTVLRLLTLVRRSSCGPIACWILARTSSLATWSLYEMCSVLR